MNFQMNFYETLKAASKQIDQYAKENNHLSEKLDKTTKQLAIENIALQIIVDKLNEAYLEKVNIRREI